MASEPTAGPHSSGSSTRGSNALLVPADDALQVYSGLRTADERTDHPPLGQEGGVLTTRVATTVKSAPAHIVVEEGLDREWIALEAQLAELRHIGLTSSSSPPPPAYHST